MKHLRLSLLCFIATGCARLVPDVDYRSAGRADTQEDARVSDAMRKAIKARNTPSEAVAVFVDALPDGVRVADTGMLTIEPGSGHQLLGKATLRGRRGNFFFFAAFLDYRETWRKGLCYWQAPLEWFTLGLWSLVPTSYLCHAGANPLTREEAIDDLRNAATAIGADLIIVFSSKEKRGVVKDMSAWLLKSDARIDVRRMGDSTTAP